MQSDNASDWHSTSCTNNLVSGVANTDTPSSPVICPISGTGTDAATPAVDTSNEVSPTGTPPVLFLNNIDGKKSVAASSNIDGITIADQLYRAGLSWKSYQESLPAQGADRVTYSDGFFTNLTDFAALGATSGDLVDLYAGKHNPFVYFRSVQEGTDAGLSLADSVGFDGSHGLYADLATGNVPAYSFIAPNQCNDQHGRGNAGQFCNYDPLSNGQQNGLNPALIERGDITVKNLVTAIKASPAWKEGNNAIVVLWDENDYSGGPSNPNNTNQVVLITDTNYGHGGVTSNTYYNHFSLLKSIESGLGLPCLNHACDQDVQVMSDLFGGRGQDKNDKNGRWLTNPY